MKRVKIENNSKSKSGNFLQFKTFLILIIFFELFLILLFATYPFVRLKITASNFNNGQADIMDVADLVEYSGLSAFYCVNKSIDNENTLSNVNFTYNFSKDCLFGKIFNLPELNFTNNLSEISINEELFEIILSDILPEGEIIIKSAPEMVEVQVVTIGQNKFQNNFKSSSTGKIYIGKVNRNDFKTKIENEFQTILINYSEFEKYEVEEILIDSNKVDTVGTLSLYDKKCYDRLVIDIRFDNLENSIYFSEDLFKTKISCNEDKTLKVLSCTDCKFAPIDKITALPNNFVPNVYNSGLPGGGLLTADTITALKLMTEDVYSKGMTVYITSAYRSYESQQMTFNSWVQRERSKGSDLDEATTNANVYSAFPGHSEHQLGTTLDIRCIGCEPFVKDISRIPLFVYLKDNAHKFGFVISYPEAKQNLTGYTYEPWHIRYIGVDLATELYELDYQNPENDVFLSNFLRQKKLY